MGNIVNMENMENMGVILTFPSTLPPSALCQGDREAGAGLCMFG